jgi:hypothetical protein
MLASFRIGIGGTTREDPYRSFPYQDTPHLAQLQHAFILAGLRDSDAVEELP